MSLESFQHRRRDDLLSRSIVRAKATRSVSLLKLKARCAFNASSVASTPRPRERFGHFLEHLLEFFLRVLLLNLRNYGTFSGVFSPAFVVVLVVLWNICRKISCVCGLGWWVTFAFGVQSA